MNRRLIESKRLITLAVLLTQEEEVAVVPPDREGGSKLSEGDTRSLLRKQNGMRVPIIPELANTRERAN